jgi:hypothetical protein
MYTLELRPGRLVLLFGAVFLVTAYLPHPQLGEPLPQSLGSWIQSLDAAPAEQISQTLHTDSAH